MLCSVVRYGIWNAVVPLFGTISGTQGFCGYVWYAASNVSMVRCEIWKAVVLWLRMISRTHNSVLGYDMWNAKDLCYLLIFYNCVWLFNLFHSLLCLKQICGFMLFIELFSLYGNRVCTFLSWFRSKIIKIGIYSKNLFWIDILKISPIFRSRGIMALVSIVL